MMEHTSKKTFNWQNLIFAQIILILIISCIFAPRSKPGTRAPEAWKITAHEDSYLGGGHPIDGVNYRRNNRSPYLLPESLNEGDMFNELFKQELQYSWRFSDLAIANDERMYIGRYRDGRQGITDGAYGQTKYSLYSFYFGNDPGKEYPGGRDIFLTGDGIYTTSFTWDESEYTTDFYGSYWSENNYSYLYSYDSCLDSAYEISTYWGKSLGAPGSRIALINDAGDWDGRVFGSIFPLPDGSVAITYGSPSNPYHTPFCTQFLEKNLDVRNDADWINHMLRGEIIGFALDTDANSLFISARQSGFSSNHSHLHKITKSIGLEWDISKLWEEFTPCLPVIDDTGGVVGAHNSYISRFGPDDVTEYKIDCGAQTRPAILNDGAIAVVCESNLKIFDTELNELSRFPLPSGPESGKDCIHAPLVDALDNMALILGPHLCIVDRDGNVIAQRTFEDDIKLIRLGPEHLFVALDYAIYRFPS